MPSTRDAALDLANLYPLSSAARRGRGASCSLQLVLAATDGQREAVQSLVRRRFAEMHHARVMHFMPQLFGLQAADGTLYGAVGCRSAQDEPLFLERYLDLPIEQAIAARTGQPIARHEIVEVGNLAVDGPGAARLLIRALTPLFVEQGFRWVAFTATPTLLNSFHRMGLMPEPLGLADPARMGDELADWGSYYDSQPQVMVGEIPRGYQQLLQARAAQRESRSSLPTSAPLRHAA